MFLGEQNLGWCEKHVIKCFQEGIATMVMLLVVFPQRPVLSNIFIIDFEQDDPGMCAMMGNILTAKGP